MKETKHMHIVTFIKDKIKKGEWAIGSRLPSQRQLALLFEVNRSTIVTALEELTAEGLIQGKTGVGTVVINNTWTLFEGNAPSTWNKNITLGGHQASSALVQEINEAESDSRLIQLSKGELAPDLFPLQQMKEVLHRVSDQLTSFGYEEPKGNRQLREAVSVHLKKRGINASPSSILIVSGALQALRLISVGLLQQGSTVYVEKPSYVYSLAVFQSAGVQLKGLPTDREGLSLEALQKVPFRPGHSVLYTNPTYHNPTSSLTSLSRRKALRAVCEEKQLPIIEDDVYRDLWLDEPPPPALKAKDTTGSMLYLGSFSKSLSAGLRIGWVVGPDAVIDRLADLKMQSDYGSSSLSQYAATEWLTSGLYEEHLATIRNELIHRRTLFVQALETYLAPYATWTVPTGGFFIWIQLHQAIDARSLFSQAKESGLLLNPGSIYAESSGRYLRLSYAYASYTELQEGVRRLATIIKEA